MLQSEGEKKEKKPREVREQGETVGLRGKKPGRERDSHMIILWLSCSQPCAPLAVGDRGGGVSGGLCFVCWVGALMLPSVHQLNQFLIVYNLGKSRGKMELTNDEGLFIFSISAFLVFASSGGR